MSGSSGPYSFAGSAAPGEEASLASSPPSDATAQVEVEISSSLPAPPPGDTLPLTNLSSEQANFARAAGLRLSAVMQQNRPQLGAVSRSDSGSLMHGRSCLPIMELEEKKTKKKA